MHLLNTIFGVVHVATYLTDENPSHSSKVYDLFWDLVFVFRNNPPTRVEFEDTRSENSIEIGLADDHFLLLSRSEQMFILTFLKVYVHLISDLRNATAVRQL